MSIFKCKMCGGDLDITAGVTVCECEYCGSKQTVPAADNEKKMTLFGRANRLLRGCEFDKAAGIFESIVVDFPEEAEAYWGLVLCKYGIEYVDDPATARKVPTCHRSSFESVMDDANFDQACENADSVARRVYRDEAKTIEELRKGIIEVSGKEAPYDIFICYKETAENGERTLDSVMAQDVYDALSEKGYRVFFSRVTLEDKLGQEYEPYIFAALNSAKIMLAFGTDYDYYNAVWVKNEWSRFLQLIAKGEKKTLIPCYKGLDAYDLPKEFAKLQAQDMGKVGAMQDLLRGIEKILPKETAAATEKNTISGGQADIAPLLKRAFMFLEDGKWQDADDYCERVLDKDPENAEAYLGKLMAEMRVNNRKLLASRGELFDNRDNFSKAIRFGDAALKKELEGYISRIKERKEKKRLAEDYDEAQSIMRGAESDSEYIRAVDAFEKISGYKDADKLAKECREKAESLKQERLKQENEAENFYTQIIEALKNQSKIEEIQDQINAAKRKKTALKKYIYENLSRYEIDKKNVQKKYEILDGNKEKMQSLTFKKAQIEKDISSAEQQRASLGIFAMSKKKELSQKIEEQNAEKAKYDDKIIKLQDAIDSLVNDIEKLGSTEDIEKKIDAFNSINMPKQQELDSEIIHLEEKLAKEVSPSKIKKEIENKQYILDYIRKKISWNSEASADLKNMFNIELPLFGTYPQGKNGEKEPIAWRVLEKDGDKALIISDKAIDYKRNHGGYESWETCFLRKWLNDDFICSAFTPEERAKILSTNTDYAITDRVFLLSINEAQKYFDSDEARKCIPTTYVIAQEKVDEFKIKKTAEGKFTCNWLLRSPGTIESNVVHVHADGDVDKSGWRYIHKSGIRPAMWIKLEP